VTGHSRGAAVKVARDIWLIFQDEASQLARHPKYLAIALIQPIAYLAFFTPFLKAVMTNEGLSTYGDAYQVYVPGLFVGMGLFSGLFAGYGLLAALRQGVIDRCRVTPVSRVGLLLGRQLMHVLYLWWQAVVITVAAALFGMRVHPADLLLSYGILGMMVLLSTSISFDIALLVRNEQTLGTLTNSVGQPLSLLAGVLIPLAIAPLWVRDLALWNPFAWAANSMRALFKGQIGNPVVWQGSLIVTAMAMAAVLLSSRLFSRDVS
jgi:ABC-2 type transport system permease protein